MENALAIVVKVLIILAVTTGSVVAFIPLKSIAASLYAAVSINPIHPVTFESLKPFAQSGIVSIADVNEYDNFSTQYDSLDGGTAAEVLGIDELRRSVGSFTAGDVVEFAVGTALQSQFYEWSNIKSYVGFDSSSGMLAEARSRILNISAREKILQQKSVSFLQADAKNTGLPSAKFDTVVDTFSMCVFDDPSAVVREMKRLVKPQSGRIILLENSRSTSPLLGWLQDATEPLITPMSKGCRWNVDVPAIARSNGLTLQHEESIQTGTISLGVYSTSE